MTRALALLGALVGGAWADLTTTGALALVASDGSNARLYNTGTASESSTLRRVA
jgi:hypothetical protein